MIRVQRSVRYHPELGYMIERWTFANPSERRPKSSYSKMGAKAYQPAKASVSNASRLTSDTDK